MLNNHGVGAKKRPAPKRPSNDPGDPSHNSDMRNVTLKRQQNSPLGFSIRGGREHGTGIYVSHVDPHSEAEVAGIKAGDQILKVNGFPVDQFVHAEVCMMLKQNNVITLKLTGTGLLPVKDRGDVVLKPVADVETSSSVSIPEPPVEPDFSKDSRSSAPTVPPAPPAPPNTMRPIPPPMPTHMFVSELHSVAQQLRKLQITKDIALENPLLKQVAINQLQHDKLMSEFKEAHRRMFGGAQGGNRFPDDFSDTDKTIERQKTERTQVLCMKNSTATTSAAASAAAASCGVDSQTQSVSGNLRSSSASSLLSLKTDSGRGSTSPNQSSSASSSPASSIVERSSPTRKTPPSKAFGVQLRQLRRESSNLELSTPGKTQSVSSRPPLRREQSNLELSSLQSELSSPMPIPIPKTTTMTPSNHALTPPAQPTKSKSSTPSSEEPTPPLVTACPFGGVSRREAGSPLEKQFIVHDKNIKRDVSTLIIPKNFEKVEFKRDLTSPVDIRGFEAIPEDPFANSRSGRTEVIFIRNSRENGRDIETSSVISSDEGSTYSGSSGCGELVGRLRRQFEDPGSDTDSSGSVGGGGGSSGASSVVGSNKLALFKRNSNAVAASGKITVSIGLAPLPKNAC